MEYGELEIEAVARAVVGDDSASLLNWSVERMGGGVSEVIGQSDGLQRCSGVVVTAAGREPWSAVVKTLRRNELEIGGMRPDVDDPHDVQYWRREADAFESGVLGDLGGGLAAPLCYRIDELTDHVVLWMEEIEAEDDVPWTIERYWVAARDLGVLNGHFAGRVPAEVRPWASRGRLHDWMIHAADGIRRMASEPRAGLLGAWLSDRSVERTARLFEQRAELLRWLEPLPETFCHHDAHRRNLITVGEGPASCTVAVDWAMSGTGRLGEELAAFTGVPLQFLDVSMSDRVVFEAAVIDGYLAGLRIGGWTGDETALRLGYKAALSLLMGVAAAGIWFSTLRDPDVEGFAERVIGHPEAEIGEQWRELQMYLLDLGEEVLLATPVA